MAGEPTWEAVDTYHESLHARDEVMERVLLEATEAGLPPIQVPPSLGRLLMIMARTLGARRILEVGTLGGYSTIWLARGLAPGGRVTTLEIEPRHVAVATANFARAAVEHAIDLRLGRALDLLPGLEGPFDLAFIDADKENNAAYFGHARRLGRPGGLIIVDNVVRDGRVLDAAAGDESVSGVRRLNELLSGSAGVEFSHLQTVGVKGYDGFVIARIPD